MVKSGPHGFRKSDHSQPTMSYEIEKSTIETYFQTHWTETPVVFDNVQAPDGLSEWVRLTIVNGDAYQASMGDNPSFRYTGVVLVQIRTKRNIGAGRALRLADQVDNLFRLLVLSNIRFKVPRLDRGPIDEEWFINNVSVDFYRGS